MKKMMKEVMKMYNRSDYLRKLGSLPVSLSLSLLGPPLGVCIHDKHFAELFKPSP